MYELKRLRDPLKPSLFLLVALTVTSAGCSASKPNFDGTWVQAGGPPIPGVVPDSNLEAQMTIKVAGSDLSTSVRVISKSDPNKSPKPLVSTFKLDGSERRAADGSVSKTYWDGDKIVFATTPPGSDKPSSTRVWSINSDGNLEVEATLNTPGSSKPARMKLVHKRVAK